MRVLAALLLASSLLPAAANAQTAAPTRAPASATAARDAALTAFLDRAFDEQVALSPEAQTQLGLKTSYDRLDDYTEAGRRRALDLEERQLAEMRRQFRPSELGEQARLSFKLFEEQVERAREGWRWRWHRYGVSTNGSPMGEIPVFLINNHKVDSAADARAYVARIRDSERVLNENAAFLREQAKRGIVPLKMSFAPVRGDARKVITGAPFTTGPDSALMADFRKKIGALKVAQAEKDALLKDGAAAMTGPMRRGFEAMFAALDAVEPQSKGNVGAWALPDGQAYYAYRLKGSTTTDLTADQIHELGLKRVAAIRGEMQAVMREVGFTGTLEQFFAKLKADPQFKYPNTAAGKEQYLSDARAVIAEVMRKAPQWFSVLPRAPLEVRAVEPFREATAATAFYNQPSLDGSRPGIFYVNLVDLTQTQKIQMPAIAAHEGAPGHHFQIARAQELAGVPKFRRLGGYGAYTEGWGLYSERLADEMGIYSKDPYTRFGMLSNQVWRAIRLVLDTGIHAKRWTREQAVAYFKANSSVSDTDIAREVDRYFNNPGQATSYMVGQLRISELRDRAKAALGPRFDIKGFHEAVLSQGALPLDVLETQVDAYVARAKAD